MVFFVVIIVISCLSHFSQRFFFKFLFFASVCEFETRKKNMLNDKNNLFVELLLQQKFPVGKK